MEVASRSTAAALVVSVLVVTGCGGPGPDPGGVASGASSPSPTLTPYDAEERAIRREALQRLEAFDAGNERILAAGRATRETKRFYQRHLREWQPSFARLEEHERSGITIARRPAVLGIRVTSIESYQDNAAEVVLERCIDRSDVGMTRDGVPVPAVHDVPVVQRVVVNRYENRTWRIGAIETTDRPCDG
jgi:hypothetical protein